MTTTHPGAVHMTTLYEVLRCVETVTPAEIKSAYRQQAMKWHPERNPANKAEAEKRFKRIAYAYKTLIDPEKKAAYDRELLANRPQNRHDKPWSHNKGGATLGVSAEDASSLFFEQMLDLAIELAARGYSETNIVYALIGLECPEHVAKPVAALAIEKLPKQDEGKTTTGKKIDASAKPVPINASPPLVAPQNIKSPEEKKWDELEPYFSAALVGPEFRSTVVENQLPLKIVRFTLFITLSALIFALLKLAEPKNAASSPVTFSIMSALAGWGIMFALLELSKSHRDYVLNARLNNYLPKFKATFLAGNKYHIAAKSIFFSALSFGYYGIIWPLIAIAITLFAVDFLQLLFITELSITNTQQIELWKLSNSIYIYLGLWLGLGYLFRHLLYGKIKAVILSKLLLKPGDIHAAMLDIYATCRPKIGRAFVVTTTVLFAAALPKIYLFNAQSEQIDAAVKAHKTAADSLFEDAKSFYFEQNPKKLSPTEALVYLKISAHNGNSNAESLLGSFYLNGTAIPKDLMLAKHWLERAASHKQPWALSLIGNSYYSGQNGFPKNEVKALENWRSAANLGSASAHVSIGWSYMQGIGGVPVSYQEALSWNEKGAAGGDSEGFNNLGWLYENGKGVQVDYQKALENYQKAAALGSPEGKERHARLQQSMDHSTVKVQAGAKESTRVKSVVTELERLFPAFNRSSPSFNEALTKQVLQRQKELMAQGDSPSKALHSAGFEVAHRAGFRSNP